MPNAGHILLALLLLIIVVVIYMLNKLPDPFTCMVCADKVRNKDQFVIVQAWDDNEKVFLAKIHLCREHMLLDDEMLLKEFHAYMMLPEWVDITVQRKDIH